MKPAEVLCSSRMLGVLVDKVHQHLGLDFSGARQADLLRRLQLLALEQECEPGSWLESLAFAEWDQALIQQLISAFTVGETYFRRDPEALDWLAREHLVPLLQHRQTDGPHHLRVWSAACCTGEEAYSLLFLIDGLLCGRDGDWRLDLLASDINDSFLARAEQGRYGANAFRRNEQSFRSRYFLAEGGRWRVAPAWRGRIRFFRYNLAADSLPDASRGLAAIDLILCRNVLMYFSAERAAATLRHLLACLSDEGLLLLSAVEAGLATQAGYQGFWAGDNYALTPSAASLRAVKAAPPRQRPAAGKDAPRAARQTLASRPRTTQPAALPRVAVSSPQPEASQPSPAQPGKERREDYEVCLAKVRRSIERQSGEEARIWLQRAVALQPERLDAYWLQLLLCRLEYDPQAALQALQRLLYLDADNAMAHFQQGLLLLEMGRRQGAERALRICRSLALQQPGERPVPDGEGLGFDQLRQLCEQLLEGEACPKH